MIAAKAVCLEKRPKGSETISPMKANSKSLAEALVQGFPFGKWRSDNHLMLIDLRPSHPELTGKQGQLALEKANVTLNRNTVPGETRSPFQTSGLRIGTPAVTSRGMQEDSIIEIASSSPQFSMKLKMIQSSMKQRRSCPLRQISATLLIFEYLILQLRL